MSDMILSNAWTCVGWDTFIFAELPLWDSAAAWHSSAEWLSLWWAWMGRLVWHATITLSLLWVVDRYWRGLPAHYRSWLWRCAYLKVFLASLFAGGLSLPGTGYISNVTTGWSSSFSVRASDVPAASVATAYMATETRGLKPGPVTEIVFAEEPFRTSAGNQREDVRDVEPRQGTVRSAVLVMLSILWCCGVVTWWSAAWWAYGKVLRDQRAGGPLREPEVLALYQRLLERFGVREAPAIWSTPRAVGPLLLGTRRPTIVLPEAFLQRVSLGELRMTLAHELAHLVRNDLFWNWGVAFVQSLLFFHPLAWLAGWRYRAAQETACDALAIRLADVTPRVYASLILRVVNRRPAGLIDLSTVAMARWSSFMSLRERIQVMQRRPLTRGELIWARCFVVWAGLLVLAPWSVAQTTESTSRPTDSSPVAGEGLAEESSSELGPAEENTREEKLVESTQVDDVAEQPATTSAGGVPRSSLGRSTNSPSKKEKRRVRQSTTLSAQAQSSGFAAAGGQASGFASGGGAGGAGPSTTYRSGSNTGPQASAAGGRIDATSVTEAEVGVSVSGGEEDPAMSGRRSEAASSLNPRRDRTVNRSVRRSSRPSGQHIMRSVSEVDGEIVKRVAVHETDRDLQIRESSVDGIEIVTSQSKAGPDSVVTVRAKNEDELRTQHPDAYSDYVKYMREADEGKAKRRGRRTADDGSVETSVNDGEQNGGSFDEEVSISVSESSEGGEGGAAAGGATISAGRGGSAVASAGVDPNGISGGRGGDAQKRLRRMLEAELDRVPEDNQLLRESLEDALEQLDE